MNLKRTAVDDVVVMPAAQVGLDTVVDVLRLAFDRVGELAEQNRVSSLLACRLVDADMRCLVRMMMTRDRDGWDSRIENGELGCRDGIAFPWYLILEDNVGRTVNLRIELDSKRKPM